MTIREQISTTTVLFTALAMVMGGTYVWQVKEERERNACQAHFNTQFVDAITRRSEISQRAADAQTNLLSGFAKLAITETSVPAKVASTPEQREALRKELKKKQAKQQAQSIELFRKYQAAMDDRDIFLKANPLPELPQGGC